MKRIIVLILICHSTFAFNQNNLKYTLGVFSSFDFLQPKHYEDNYEYFTSYYTNGFAINLGIRNRINYKKYFTQFDFGYNYASQKQTFVFSNSVDKNIGHTLSHDIPHCSFNWSFGHDFVLKNKHIISVEGGMSTMFSLVIGPYNLKLLSLGTFTSTYSDANQYWSGEMITKDYNYEIEYERPTLLTPFLRIGTKIPLGKNYLVYGVNAQLKRLVYENFIYISSDTYSAIANSRSQSYSIGFFLNYQFRKKPKGELEQPEGKGEIKEESGNCFGPDN